MAANTRGSEALLRGLWRGYCRALSQFVAGNQGLPSRHAGALRSMQQLARMPFRPRGGRGHGGKGTLELRLVLNAKALRNTSP
jgi:hypothetical protein